MRVLIPVFVLLSSVCFAKELPAGFASVESVDEAELGVMVRGTLAEHIYDRLTGVHEQVRGALKTRDGVELRCQRAVEASESLCGFRILDSGEIESVSGALRAFGNETLAANLDREDTAPLVLNLKEDLAVATLAFLGQEFPKTGLMRMEQGDTRCSMFRGAPRKGGIYRPRIRKCTFRFSDEGKVVR